MAFVHTLAAYLIAVFFVGHVYLITTGHTVLAHIKAMFSGWEEVEGEADGGNDGAREKTRA